MDFKKFFILICCISALCTQCQKADEAIFIIPRDYTGYILIVYNQPSGEPERYLDNKRVYTIPENGILKSQFPINDGWSFVPEFYYDEIAEINKLPFVTEANKIPEDEVAVHGGTVGSLSRDNEKKERIKFVQYYVGNRQQINQAFKSVELLDIGKFSD